MDRYYNSSHYEENKLNPNLKMEGKNEGLKSLYMLEVFRVFGFYNTEDN